MASDWTEAQKSYTEYIIGAVESGWDYAGTYTVDAITLGITQWYGANARRLLGVVQEKAPESYEKNTQRVKDAVRDHGESEWDWWAGFYLSKEDVAGWQACAADTAVHAIQDQLFMDDTFGDGRYTDTLQRWGVDLTDVKNTIMLISAYHQNPRNCQIVIATIGGKRDYHDTHTAILSNPVFSGYVNRYNRVLELLDAWDGTSAPPDFGQASTVPPDQERPDVESASSIKYIESANSQDLIIHGDFGGGDLLCRYNGNDTWYPVRGDKNDDYPSTTPQGGGSGNDTEFGKMRALWEQHNSEFYYSQGGGRLDPISSGYSDCSASIWWAANAVTDKKYEWLGTYTQAMIETCGEPVILSRDGVLDHTKMLPGDLIVIEWPNNDPGEFHNEHQHVDWYWGDGVVWGSGSSPLPKHVTDDVDHYLSGAVRWVRVMRFLKED